MFGILKPRLELEFDEGEHILHYTRRHWVLLWIRVAIPLLIAVVLALLAFYRAIGGLFFATDVGPEGRLLDIANLVYIALALVLLFWWLRREAPKKKSTITALLLNGLVVLAMVVLGLVVYFRYSGGRVFSVDPAYARGGDLFNVALIVLSIGAALVVMYIVADWANDFLILTNTRVVYDDTQLLVRHVQQDILLDNIQQVSLSAESYFAYFLGQLAFWRDQFLHAIGVRKVPPPEKVAVAYGKLVIGSLSARRLVFDWAANPLVMQQRINGELGKLRKQQEPELLRQIIEDQVYDHMKPLPVAPPIHVAERAGPVPWLFHTNPEVNYKTEEVTWRPYWIFLLLGMLSALLGLILVTILLVVLVQLGFVGAGLAFVFWLPVALVCLGRIIWVREEHEHDKYILQRDKIIDVDKKPFGPESSRVAQLGSIQDVSFDVSFVESILGYGDVTILTGGAGGKFTFKHVPDARGVTATINDYLTDFKKREKARQQQATLDLLKQYHALQREHGELIDDERLQDVAGKVAEYIGADMPAQIEREVATQLPDAVRRQVDGTVRRELWRSMLARRRRS
jgi:hypothetical protein